MPAFDLRQELGELEDSEDQAPRAESVEPPAASTPFPFTNRN